MKQRNKKNKEIQDILKSTRKQSRDEEIKAHGKPILFKKVEESKKKYKRIKKVDFTGNE